MKKTSIDNEDIVSSQDENEVGVSAVFQEYRTECFLRQPRTSILVILISNALAVNPLSVKKYQV